MDARRVARVNATLKSDVLNVLLTYFINYCDELLSNNCKIKGVPSEIKTKIKEAIKAKEGT